MGTDTRNQVVVDRDPVAGRQRLELTESSKTGANYQVTLRYHIPEVKSGDKGESLTVSLDYDRAQLRVGETVKLGYVDQSRDTLAPDKTVWQEVSGGNEEIDLGRRKMPSRAYCSLFNFRGTDQQKKVGQLSGGARNLVHLAKMLKQAQRDLIEK